jgi:hypothetical protein
MVKRIKLTVIFIIIVIILAVGAGIYIRFEKDKFERKLTILSAIEEAIDSTSNIAGIYLKFISSDSEGHSSFEVFTLNEDKYPLNMFNASLKISLRQENTSTDLSTLSSEYISVTGGGGEMIDYINSLDEVVSQNGYIRFIDKNSNSLIDDHDIFNLSIPPTKDDNRLETYLFLIGTDNIVLNNIAIAAGVKYLINWYNGIYEQQTEKELIALNYVSHEENGTLIDTTTLKVTRANSKADLSIRNYSVMLEKNYNDQWKDLHINEKLSAGTFIKKDNISVSFIDSNENGLLDVDDLFLIKGLENKTSIVIALLNNNCMVTFYQWIVGYGHPLGNTPEISLENKVFNETNNQYKIEFSPSFWHPELKYGLTLQVSLSENNVTILDNMTITKGGVLPFIGPISIVDADKDTYLSTGDYLLIGDCLPNSEYYVEVSLLYGKTSSSIKFNTQ